MADQEYVLGISADYHDAAACLLAGGELVVAAEEERFSRIKHDPSLPVAAIRWCLEEAGLDPPELAAVAFASKPLSTYERILSTNARVGPRGFRHLSRAVVTWSRSKLWAGYRLERVLGELGFAPPEVHFVEHHQSHAASAYYPSPFEQAAVLTVDGVGEWATTSIARGVGKDLEMLREIRYPDSLGLLYSAVTGFCGFEVNEGEQQLMGLAPYGAPIFADRLRTEVIRLLDDGSFRLDPRWFELHSDHMYSSRMAELFDGPPAGREEEPGQREADIARSVQVVLEEAVLELVRTAVKVTGQRSLCLAGGVALNCVANRRIIESGLVDDLWIQPAAGDAGGAIGAAGWSWHMNLGHERTAAPCPDGMNGSFLGPRSTDDEVADLLAAEGLPFRRFADAAERDRVVATALAAGETIGWYCGRSEFGPRALGHRSILADPRDAQAVTRINAAVKRREGFRPFAPAVLAEHAREWFDTDRDMPYMLVTAPVRETARVDGPITADTDFPSRLAATRSTIPACTHVDHSARVQTVDRDRNPEFHGLLAAFRDLTGCPVLLNTSFNRSGEPIVGSPSDALRCAVAAGLDGLAIENCYVDLPTTGGRP